MLETRSDALDSSIPASPVRISNTYQQQESHLVKRGVPPGLSAGMLEAAGGWDTRVA